MKSYSGDLYELEVEDFQFIGNSPLEIIRFADYLEYNGVFGRKIFKNRTGIVGVVEYSHFDTREIYKMFEAERARDLYMKQMGW